MSEGISTETEWARNGTTFSSRSRADQTKSLPGGIYRFVSTMQGWYLDRTANFFEFPFKVYGSNDQIINRISTYWMNNGSNLGVLLTGLRGSGKTMAAQQLANKLITELEIPVLVVRDPIPLQIVFESVQQHMMVIFDEFEKTHDKDQQKALLSTVDGMNRSKNKRLILFTTNTLHIDENFRDRPSRIHYSFEFNKLSDEVIEGLVDDGLPKELKHFKKEIIDFVSTRSICTIDIVKAVIAEVRTFKESPIQFEDMLNISKGEPPAYTIKVLDPEKNTPIETVYDYFRPSRGYDVANRLMGGNKKAIEEFKLGQNVIEVQADTYEGKYALQLLEKCPEENVWLAHVGVPPSKTVWGDFHQLIKGYMGYTIFKDAKPKNWKIDFTPESVRTDKKDFNKAHEMWNNCWGNRTEYGSGAKLALKISIEPNKDAVVPSRWKAGSPGWATEDE